MMLKKSNDDLLMEDELAAAFLDGNNSATLIDDMEIEEEVVEVAPQEDAFEESTENNTPSESKNDGWEDTADDFPGQLAVDVYETKDKLVIKARTAGISKQDLDVSIADNILTISGVLNSNEDLDITQWHIQECYWGEFSRTIALPAQIKEEGIEAILKDGVLTINFEKEKTETKRKIQIA